MFAAIDDALAGLYPGRSWHPSWPRRYDADRDAAALADELADELRIATFVRPAGDGGCAFIYVLAMGRPPCAIQVRDADLPVPDEWTVDGGVIRERYLRIALATSTPFAVVQELAVDVEPDTGGVLVREQALSGVFSAPLLARFQRIVATLPAYDRRHLDMGELMASPPGFDGGDWGARYHGQPAVVNYLFFAEPAAMTATTWLARA